MSLSINNKVLTNNGWMNIGELRKGDSVLGMDKVFRPVLDIIDAGECDCKVKFTDGSELICSCNQQIKLNKAGVNGLRNYNIIDIDNELDSFDEIESIETIGATPAKSISVEKGSCLIGRNYIGCVCQISYCL